MNAEIVSDQRKHPRARFRNQIHTYLVRESNTENILEVQKDALVVKTVDLSQEGIRLELGKSISLNQFLKIRIEVNKSESIDAFSRQVWSSKKYAGYKFILLDRGAEKCIREFVKQLT